MFAGSLSLWFCGITEEWLTRGQWCEAAAYLPARIMPCCFVCREQTIVWREETMVCRYQTLVCREQTTEKKVGRILYKR